jgi:hypothetical protein
VIALMVFAMLGVGQGVVNLVLGTVSVALVSSGGLGVWVRLW